MPRLANQGLDFTTPEIVDKINKIQPTQDGLREAMMLLIPTATRYACGGSAQWALYLIKMAERYLPEWRDKKKSITTIDDYVAVQEKLLNEESATETNKEEEEYREENAEETRENDQNEEEKYETRTYEEEASDDRGSTDFFTQKPEQDDTQEPKDTDIGDTQEPKDTDMIDAIIELDNEEERRLRDSHEIPEYKEGESEGEDEEGYDSY